MAAWKAEIGYFSKDRVIRPWATENVLEAHHYQEAAQGYYGHFYGIPTVLSYEEKIANQNKISRNQKIMCPQEGDTVHDLGIHIADIRLNKTKYRIIKADPVLFDDPINQKYKSKEGNDKKDKNDQ